MGKVLPVVSLVCGGVNGFLFLLQPRPMLGVIALMLVTVGVLQLFATAFVVAFAHGGGGEVQVKNPLGMTVWRHEFASVADLTIDGTKLYVLRTDGKRKKLGGFSVDAADMTRLGIALTERRR